MNSAPVLIPWLIIWITAPSSAICISGEDSEQHESHVADAGVGDEALEIGLSDRKHCTVENSDDADCHHEGSQSRAMVREREATRNG